MRTHRSYLVNLLYVQNIIESDVITIYQELIPISKKYHAEVKASFTDYIYQK
ncbi:MAG: LytTR family transcriptional regulator DNA-binding domain-containing protein [Culicoidibacterales bacterium]